MDLTGGLRGAGALFDRPGAAFVAAGRQERDEAEQLIARLNQTVEAGLLQAQLFHEHGLFVRVVQLGDVRLQLGADRQGKGALLVGQLLDLLEVRHGLRIVHGVLRDVRGIDRPLERQQVRRGDEGAVVVGAFERAGKLALIQMLEQGREDLRLAQEALVAALGGLLGLVHAALAHFGVGEDELEIDDVDVAQRVCAALDMGDVRVVKAAHDVDDGVCRADVRKELVAEALTLGRALDKACNVDEFDRGGREFLRLMQVAQPLQTRIWHGHDADVRIDGAEGVVIGGNARICDRVEQRGLADVRQSDDTKFHGC